MIWRTSSEGSVVSAGDGFSSAMAFIYVIRSFRAANFQRGHGEQLLRARNNNQSYSAAHSCCGLVFHRSPGGPAPCAAILQNEGKTPLDEVCAEPHWQSSQGWWQHCSNAKKLAKTGRQPRVNHIFGLKKFMMKKTWLGLLALQTTALLLSAPALTAQDKPAVSAPDASKPQPGAAATARFSDEMADKALLAMKKHAGELHIQGVAVVAFAPGESEWPTKLCWP